MHRNARRKEPTNHRPPPPPVLILQSTSSGSARPVPVTSRANQSSASQASVKADSPRTPKSQPASSGSPSPPHHINSPRSLESVPASSSSTMPNRSMIAGNDAELKLYVKNMPPRTTTWQIYDRLQKYGHLDRIEIQDSRRDNCTNAWVTFIPPPTATDWIRTGFGMESRGKRYHVEFTETSRQSSFRHQSPMNAIRNFPEQMRASLSRVGFGVMKTTGTMLVLQKIDPITSVPMELVLNLQYKALDIIFAVVKHVPAKQRQDTRTIPQRFKIRLNLTQLRSVVQMNHPSTGQTAWIISTDQPPMVFRKANNVRDTHEHGAKYWRDFQTWFRETEISVDPQAPRREMTQLQKGRASIADVGRWLTYKLVFDKGVVGSPTFNELSQALSDHSVPVCHDKIVKFDFDTNEYLWSWLDKPAVVLQQTQESSTLSEMHQMARETIHLPFDLRYQLEVCISHGVLYECNITKEFLARLGNMDSRRAVRLLEKAADEGKRFYDPNEIFPQLLHKVSVVPKAMPEYCAMIRAATVTPTTVYFMTPIVETSNRTIRKFQQLEDRFLRVKFTDEKYKGRIRSSADATLNEVYSRIKRTMVDGINVAGRHYQFLAFGNSQFREHGAWFFASNGSPTVQEIRDQLGDFASIKVVAKYCSRIGQCFSTSKATKWSVREEKIPDITRNGFCFTDGVGKISPVLARLIATEHGHPDLANTCPSTFQFRREGCKGILVVDPALKSNTIQIRPSQEKFTGAQNKGGLDIVRVSQFSTAYLNVQLILVLSALGVEDDVFVEKMKHMLSDLRDAMTSAEKAVKLLSRYVDYNRMSLQLASMIESGFMQTQDPFTVSCLRLWRSWSLKYLKEKARICVEQGAFVFGCVDETATLRGHFENRQPSANAPKDPANLPEIFLQINSSQGHWQVIEGVCILMRNPSLHPGDVRVVMAVDVPALHHIRDCVVLPQTGDRDLANMCSGGDLDGDDYLVMWDEALLPKEWNHRPMDYRAPTPVAAEGKVTVDDMTSFFVKHMKYDLLGPIAVAHKYWADSQPDGVKDPICMELARRHSMAVDFAKTGVEADLPQSLKVQRWPHWSEQKNKSKGRIYHSKRIIGQLYDAVQRDPFTALWSLPFDKRILEAYELEDRVLQSAREAKAQYDEAVRRVMAKFGIGNEFEVWTTFVMEHSDDIGDYKFAEAIGEAVAAIKAAHQKLCYERAGTTERDRDWSRIGPFVAAMYVVTAQEASTALAECRRVVSEDDQHVPAKEPCFDNMPFISFPWLFPTELGRIANGTEDRQLVASQTIALPFNRPADGMLDGPRSNDSALGDANEAQMLQPAYESWKTHLRRDSPLSTSSETEELLSTFSMLKGLSAPPQPSSLAIEPDRSEPGIHAGNVTRGIPSAVATTLHHPARHSTASAVSNDMETDDSVESEEDEMEVEMVTLDVKPSSLDTLTKFIGS